MMMAGFDGSGELSSASKGHERELFVNTFLSQIFPPNYRFGCGDLIDGHTEKSGQVDIVIEYPNFMSFPYLMGGPRLYLAEGVAATIEVKSNLPNQWEEALATAKKVKKLKRIFLPDRDKELAPMLRAAEALRTALGHPAQPLPKVTHELTSYQSVLVNEKYPPQQVPVFLVGYKGWMTQETLSEKLHSTNGVVDSILTLEPLMYHSNSGASSQGIGALFQFIDGLFYFIQKDFMQVPMSDIYSTPRNFFEEIFKTQ
ncbi:hypothetical protein PS659_03297 [Pseudomonas fluorescens]|uniref:DUF6602 domain-containing protein n=2 Tax=Pseudomonas fluorescens TaxID=294 RepID=A0A5E6U945_PSEFL|nr:hypothetical protein PS659_03297 [Pseudomonas fluorescens]